MQIVVALIPCVVAAVLVWYVPQLLESRGYADLEKHGNTLAAVLAGSFSEEIELNDFEAIKNLDDVVFAVTLSDSGTVKSFAKLFSSDSSKTAQIAVAPEAFESTILTTSASLFFEDGSVGSLVLGISKATIINEIDLARKTLQVFGVFLLLLSINLVVLAIRMSAARINVEKESALALSETILREKAEDRYKKLSELSNQFDSREKYEDKLKVVRASIDQSAHISGSVDESTARGRVEEALNHSSKRLEALNDIAVSALRSVHQEIIVVKALDHLAEIIDYDFARVVEYDQWKGEGRVIASRFDPNLDIIDHTHMPISYFRAGDNVDRFQRYTPDIGANATPPDLDQDFLDAGLQSYFRQSLQVGDEIIGVMTVCSCKKNAFSTGEMKAGRDLVDLISLAISVSRQSEERDRYEAELISAKDRAEEMARLKTAFLSNMSHEIRTPLSGIIGFAQVLESELEGEMQEFSALIHRGATRLLDTINSVLDFAKLEAGQLSMVPKPTDVNETIRDTVKMLKPLALRKDLELQFSLSQEPILCTLDRSSLERIINNLVGNAIKFTEEGYIEISTEVSDEFGHLIVSDTGIGISDEFMPNLFNEFHQQDMGSEREHQGSGLGLAITRRLVDKMGGWIEVENREVRGVTFVITFPLSIGDEAHSLDRHINSVLIVSDPDELSDTDYAQLQHEIDLQSATSLKAAVQHARHRRFDLVVVKVRDIDPEAELTSVRAVRDIPNYDTVPIIAVSAAPFSTDEQRYLRREFDGFSHEPQGMAAYLLRITEHNRQYARNKVQSLKPDDELDAQWDDGDPYGDDFDTSHLFGDDEQRIKDLDDL